MTAEITPETIKDALHGAASILFDVTYPIDVRRKRHAAIKSMIAHATEMDAVMKAKDRPDKPGWYVYRNPTYPLVVREVLAGNLSSYPYEPKGNWFGPFNFALTETKRPATTGEGMGGEVG